MYDSIAIKTAGMVTYYTGNTETFKAVAQLIADMLNSTKGIYEVKGTYVPLVNHREYEIAKAQRDQISRKTEQFGTPLTEAEQKEYDELKDRILNFEQDNFSK